MAYFPPPNKNEISAIPSPSNLAHNAGLGKLWDWLTALFGTGGKPEHVYAALKLLDPKAILNLKPTFAVDTNALTITFADKDGNALSADNPAFVGQRHATLSDGGFLQRKLEANVSLVISAGSTLGHVAGFLLPIYLYLIDNGGVQEPAASRSFFGESGIVDTTAEGGAGAADSATVMYSEAARSNAPFRLIGIAWFTQATAGDWVNLPSEVKGPPFLLEKVGEIVAYGGGAVEYGFYLQDGSNVLRAGDAGKLFGKVGTNFGVGDGSTTFGVGDSRRRTLVGSGGTGTGTLGNAVGNAGGEEGHAQTQAEMASHIHTQNKGGAGATTSDQNRISDRGAGTTTYQNNNGLVAAGSGAAANVIQPSLVVTKMIRWLGDI